MSVPTALRAYLIASRLAAPVAGPLLARRRRRGKEDPERLGERLGRAGMARPGGRVIWLHGASVGEAMSILPLIEALRAEGAGGAALHFLVTTGTVTAARRMAAVLPDDAIHQYVPVDTAPAVRRFLDHWRPDVAVWIESELWPRLIHETRRRGVPMALVNARISARSHARWRRFPAMARALLSAFDTILTQDSETVERMADLGAKARFGGNLKALVPAPGCDAGELAALRLRLQGRRIWLAASTHPDEEEAAIAAQETVRERYRDALLILAPRHPERGDDVAGILTEYGVAWARRSAGEPPTPGTAVWLADTLGEMGLWYRLAPITFVGGSLAARGGHTPFEPVALGSAVLHGPDTSNFAPSYAALDAAGGARAVADAEELGRAVGDLLADEAARARMVAAATGAQAVIRPDIRAIARDLLAMARDPVP